MVPGWVYWEGAGWAIPGTHPAARFARGECPYSEAGPRKALQGPGVGWYGCSDVRWAGRLLDPPCGPGRSPWALPGLGPSECPPRANRARFDLILLKVSQNSQVSPKSVYKACHSPYFQNGSQKSALDFLRFPFVAAFSHKELMGPF